MSTIADLRKDYQLQSLSEKDVSEDCMQQFKKWWEEAIHAQIDEANAMTLATASADGLPSARIVLLKGVSENGFTFFTNYNSYKAQHLSENPRACLVFFWKELERQIRITGLVDKVSAQESDEYFNRRPLGSRIGAWASPQSSVIQSREWLETAQHNFERKFSDNQPSRPQHWGGYLVRPITVEFWQGRSSRLHDRIQYSLLENGNWKIERLAP